jgi:hypothetical protein
MSELTDGAHAGLVGAGATPTAEGRVLGDSAGAGLAQRVGAT